MSEDNFDSGDSEWGGESQVSDNVENSFQDEPVEQTEPLEEAPEQDSDTQEVEAIAPESKKHSNRPLGKTRINQLRREKYRAENEANLLRAENDRLKKLNDSSTQAAMVHYDSSVKLRLDRAKQVKALAIENGDVNAQVDADVEIGRIAAQMEQLEAYKSQESVRERQQAPEQEQYRQQQRAPQAQLNEDTESWLADNTWFVPNSPDFDQDMHQEVQAYAESLDRKLRRTGQEDKIMTREYFDEINNYVQREFYEQEDTPPPQPSRNLNMKQASSRAPVAPVGKTGGRPNPANPRQITLTSEEKDFIRFAKISPEEYVKQKAAIAQSERTRGAQRRG